MEIEEAKKEAEKLRKELDRHRYLYYVLDRSEIPDADYDHMFRRLQELEEQFPQLITPDSPTKKVGAPPLERFEPYTHAVPMLSLANAFNESELREFDRRLRSLIPSDKKIEYLAELKLDGLAVELVFRNGIFIVASTRGDGYTGENVTENVKTIKAVSLRLRAEELQPPSLLEVRGEVFMNIDDFHRLNRKREEKGEPAFANPRNASAGSLRQLDSSITASRPLQIYFYATGNTGEWNPRTQEELLQTLQKWGLRINPHYRVCRNIGEVQSFYHEVSDLREKLQYEIDGIVIKLNSIEDRKLAGEITHHPRWALAYKFPAKQVSTRIKDIIVQVGRTGQLTPVAELEPVEVGGVTVSRATLHNEDEIRRKDIRIGDVVIVERAGDVIPSVVSVIPEPGIKRAKPYKFPQNCPVCSAPVKRPENEVAYYCTGISCSAQLKGLIRHFAQRSAMDIEGLGEKLIDRFVDEGLLRSIADIYTLDRDMLAGMEGLGERSADNLIRSIESSKTRDFTRVLFAIGIRFVGERTSKILAKEFSSMEAIMNAEKSQLEQIPEIGPRIADSVYYFFRTRQNNEVIEKLKRAGLRFALKETKDGLIGDKSFSGKRFLFTGTLTSMTRNEAGKHVEALGGEVVNAISSKLDFLVVGENPGSKLDKAIEMGIRIIDEKEFLGMIKKSSS